METLGFIRLPSAVTVAALNSTAQTTPGFVCLPGAVTDAGQRPTSNLPSGNSVLTGDISADLAVWLLELKKRTPIPCGPANRIRDCDQAGLKTAGAAATRTLAAEGRTAHADNGEWAELSMNRCALMACSSAPLCT
jgi:hypothetical protein